MKCLSKLSWDSLYVRVCMCVRQLYEPVPRMEPVPSLFTLPPSRGVWNHLLCLWISKTS